MKRPIAIACLLALAVVPAASSAQNAPSSVMRKAAGPTVGGFGIGEFPAAGATG